MERIPFSLGTIRVAREMRGGQREQIRLALGLSPRSMDKIETTYRDVPDAVLARIERLLDDREKLRHMIATLLQNR